MRLESNGNNRRINPRWSGLKQNYRRAASRPGLVAAITGSQSVSTSVPALLIGA